MRTKVATAIAIAGILFGTAGCGSSSGQQGTTPSAQALVNDALTALRTAHSVRVSGGIVQNARNLHVDMGFHQSGSLSGTMRGPFAGIQATFQIIIVGGKGYILMDKALFDAIAKAHHLPSATCAVICGKYIEVPATQFGNFTLNGLRNSILKSGRKAAPGVTTTTLNGQPVYRVSDGHRSYLYIAENGTHYPLEITKSGTGTLVFSEWNSVPPATAPPASEVITSPGGIG